MGKLLIVIGLVCVAAGLALVFQDRLGGLGELLSRLPVGRLPGDIFVEREGFRFSFPIVTCLVVSVVLTLLFALFKK